MSGAVLEVAYVPLDEFVVWLTSGWSFCGFVVQPIPAMPHGCFACLMVREAADA